MPFFVVAVARSFVCSFVGLFARRRMYLPAFLGWSLSLTASASMNQRRYVHFGRTTDQRGVSECVHPSIHRVSTTHSTQRRYSISYVRPSHQPKEHRWDGCDVPLSGL
mmetsp:Transcript_30429/g.88436  ORF Transcript_30429/g.88436 Transcript_30429/m.88436 type:complete len:108 (+) Transcript_30429:672-995(+)